jgi:hypothetical protein
MGVDMAGRENRGLSWPAVVGWVCALLFGASLWSGADSGPLLWLGVVSIDVLFIGWIYVLARWISRKVESRVH